MLFQDNGTLPRDNKKTDCFNNNDDKDVVG
jgi:hypothetical protein